MSTEEQQEVEEQTVFEPLTWVNYVPLIQLETGSDDEIANAFAYAAEQGWNLFYALGSDVTSKQVQNKGGVGMTTVNEYHPRIFKFVRNLAGEAVSIASEGKMGPEIPQRAVFRLPSIPWDLIDRVETFFRHVDEKFGTEAIILFTFDEEYLGTENPSDGWGVMVPDQQNSAGSCDYDPLSIVDPLDDAGESVSVVGTAHSHPGMGAFCSSTDKGDQANFDGIHITFGWHGKSKKTDFHIELQMHGAAYQFKAEDLFEDMPEEVDDVIEDWTSRVKKLQRHPTGTGTTTTSGGGGASGKGLRNYDHLPKPLPRPDAYNCIVAIPLASNSDLKECPVCLGSKASIAGTGKCTICDSYVVTLDTSTIDGLIDLRQSKGLKSPELDHTTTFPGYKHVWVWEERMSDEAVLTDYITLFERGSNKSSTIPADVIEGVTYEGKAEGVGENNSSGPSASSSLHCGTCGEPLDDDDDECLLCFTPTGLSQFDAANRAAQNMTRLRDKVAGRSNARYMICCRADSRLDCECKEPVTFLEADTQVMYHDAETIPYKPGGGCQSCELMFSADCDEYVNFLRVHNMLTEAGSYEAIKRMKQLTRCNDYVSNEKDMVTYE